MQQIDYSSHWNWKLANKSFFTTIRLNSSKYRLGEIYKHVYKDFAVEAALVKIDVRRWNDFSEFELALDTGYNRTESENSEVPALRRRVDTLVTVPNCTP